MVTDDFTCDVETLVGASGTMSDAFVDCDLTYVPVFFRGMTVFEGAENGPAPTPFIAETVKYVDDPAVSPEMVWYVSASTTTCPTNDFFR